jgi:hypothetical protein
MDFSMADHSLLQHQLEFRFHQLESVGLAARFAGNGRSWRSLDMVYHAMSGRFTSEDGRTRKVRKFG